MSALTDYLKTQRVTDREINAVLEKAARDARRELARLGDAGDRVRIARLRSTIAEIKRQQHELWSNGIRDATVRGRQAAAQAAQMAARTLDSSVWGRATPRNVASRVARLQADARSRIMAAVNRPSRALSARIYKNEALANGRIEALIRSHIVRGSDAKTLARSIYQFISPSAPGGASSAALRLAREEMAEAFHNAQVIGARERPWVKAMRWILSGSHPKPDQCNAYAGREYKIDNVPDRPHPLCLCTLEEIPYADPRVTV